MEKTTYNTHILSKINIVSAIISPCNSYLCQVLPGIYIYSQKESFPFCGSSVQLPDLFCWLQTPEEDGVVAFSHQAD